MSMFFQILVVLLTILLGGQAHSQELKICEEGIDKCKPLISQPEKYSKCMKLMCMDYYSEKDKKNKDYSKYFFKYVGIEDKRKSEEKTSRMAQTCEYGLRKCDVLRNVPEYYWECMTDSCRNPSNTPPDCELGQNMCVDMQKIYNDCMKFTCGNPSADFDSCPRAKFSCTESLRSYWHCVYGVCLGPVDEYRRPPSSKIYMIVEDAKGKRKKIQINRTEPILASAPMWAAKAPDGVDPEEWIVQTPQKFLLNGNPSDYMQCMFPTALIDCQSNDLRSCRCSDGTMPILMNGVPSHKMDE